MNQLRSICVFCGSSSGGKDLYRLAAESLGRELVSRGIRLVYGAGSVGLMGVVARTVHDRGGEVLGIIPSALAPQEMAGANIGETIIVENMHERKARMAEEADGFIAMPGGFGTLDELSEMITWGQLGLQRKPIGIFNVAGFYDPLLQWIDQTVKEGFIRPQFRQLYVVTDDASLLLERMALQQLPSGVLQTGRSGREVDLR